jgi:hypothetical protein
MSRRKRRYTSADKAERKKVTVLRKGIYEHQLP